MTDEIPAPIADSGLSTDEEYDLDGERAAEAQEELLAELFAVTLVEDDAMRALDLAWLAEAAGVDSNVIASAQTTAKTKLVEGGAFADE